MTGCTIEGCAGKHLARGLCTAHYKRFKRHGDPLGGGTEKGAPTAFLAAAIAMETTDCIEWSFGKKEGYGFLNDGAGGTITASRSICLMAHGAPADEAMEAAHSCGNRACCNKHHIRWATFVENSADKRIHGTLLVGESVPSSRFVPDDIRAMRRRHRNGESYASIARSYQTTTGHVRRIVLGELWPSVPFEMENAA
jgi:hypothetical protein